MLKLSRDELKELLSSAYESGWRGCLELKSEYAEQIVSRFDHVSDEPGGSTFTVAASTNYSINSSGNLGFVDSSSTFIPGYYTSFSQTSPMETLSVNNPGRDAF